MDYGLFTMPSHPPERKLFDGHQWDLQQLRWADELGFSEAWIGEHHTAPWEPHPSPDLLVAQALLQTKRMRIGPGGFLMPYHHPAELANRVAMLDHLAQGRLNFGVAASGLPSDWAMFNVDGMSGQHREMTRESLDIILRLWSDEAEFDYKGKYWHVTKTGTDVRHAQAAHQAVPEAAPADRRGRAEQGLRHAEAGRRARLLADEPEPEPDLRGQPLGGGGEGAARSGRTPKRSDWRMVREVFVADTDAEAHAAVGGRHDGPHDDGVLPAAASAPSQFTRVSSSTTRTCPDSDVTPEYCAKHNWLVGSPEHGGRRKLQRDLRARWAASARCCSSASTTRENPKAWHHSMELLAKEVMPKFKGLVPK